MRISKKMLENKLNDLKQISGIENLQLDFAACYGGYRLVTVTKNGGHSGAFGESSCCARVRIGAMYTYLDTLIKGIEFSKNK